MAGFLDPLGGILPEIFGDVLRTVSAILNDFFEALSSFLNDFVAVYNAFVDFGLSALGKIGSFFKYVWQNGISKLISGALSLLQKLHRFLEAKLAPVIKFLTHVRAIIDKYYKLYLKPYLAFIQRIRRYLLVLKLLHVKWAERLDARLARTESTITRLFLDVRASVNMLLNVAQSLTDPRKLSRWVLASVAGRRVAAASIRAITGLPIGHFFPSNAVGRFAFERPPLTAHDYTDPRFNPPPSVIMAGLLGGPDLGDTIDPDPPDDATLDATQPLDYYGDMMQALVAGESFYDDLDATDLSITQTIEQQNGPLFDVGSLLADFTASLSAA